MIFFFFFKNLVHSSSHHFWWLWLSKLPYPCEIWDPWLQLSDHSGAGNVDLGVGSAIRPHGEWNTLKFFSATFITQCCVWGMSRVYWWNYFKRNLLPIMHATTSYRLFRHQPSGADLTLCWGIQKAPQKSRNSQWPAITSRRWLVCEARHLSDDAQSS